MEQGRFYRNSSPLSNIPLCHALFMRLLYLWYVPQWRAEIRGAFGYVFLWCALLRLTSCQHWCGWFSMSWIFDVKPWHPLGGEIFPDAKVMRAWTSKYRCATAAQKIRHAFLLFLSCLIKRRYFRFFAGCSLLCVHFLSHSFRIVKSPHPEDITLSFTSKIFSKWKISTPHQHFRHWS